MSRAVLVNPQLSQSSWDAPLLRAWGDAGIKHGLGSLAACLKEKGHSVSLVDAVSFVCIREMRIDSVWTLDQHFADEGFEIVA